MGYSLDFFSFDFMNIFGFVSKRNKTEKRPCCDRVPLFFFGGENGLNVYLPTYFV